MHYIFLWVGGKSKWVIVIHDVVELAPFLLKKKSTSMMPIPHPVHHYDTHPLKFSEISLAHQWTLSMREGRVRLIGTELWRNSMEEGPRTDA